MPAHLSSFYLMYRSSLGLSSAAATAVAEYLLAGLPEQQGEAGATAALLLLQCIVPSAEAPAALQAGSLLLSRDLAADAWKVCSCFPCQMSVRLHG